MSDGTKICPMCAETIQAAAILCRFCKHDFNAPAAAKKGPPILLILIIIGACAVPFLAIIAAIAIPGVVSGQRAANERRAAVALKTLASAEADFRINDRDGNKIEDFWVGDVRQLYSMVVDGKELRLIEPWIAEADVSSGTPPKSGYAFAAIRLDADGKPYNEGEGRNRSRFAFCAFPVTPASGKRTFIINEENRVWSARIGGQRVPQWPGDPAAAGWQSLD